MTRFIHVAVLLALCLAWHRPLTAQSSERRITGVALELRTGGQLLEGELLAVGRDTLWFGPETSTMPLPMPFADILDARIKTHEFGARRTLIWTAIGWAATSLGLFAACSQADDGSGCGGVPVLLAIPWGIVGGIGAAVNERSTWQESGPDRLHELGAYSRFPQGLPDPARP